MPDERGVGLGRWVKKLKGLRSTIWFLQEGRGDVECSIGYMVNCILVAMCGVRWVWDFSRY